MSQPNPSDGPPGDMQEIHRALGSLPGISEPPLVDPGFRIEFDHSGRDPRDDDRFLVRFYSVCIFLVGLTTCVPSLYQWIETARADEILPVPRWVYLLGFVGSLHLLYALLLFQIDDYSALQSLATFLLLITCLYGFAVITLVLGDRNGPVQAFLQLPSVLQPRAAIWCGIMFGISALSCYLLGREAMIFRRRQSVRRA